MIIVSVCNPKGGQGKSLVSINLATAVLAGRYPAIFDRGAFTIRSSGVFSRADQDCKTIFDSALAQCRDPGNH